MARTSRLAIGIIVTAVVATLVTVLLRPVSEGIELLSWKKTDCTIESIGVVRVKYGRQRAALPSTIVDIAEVRYSFLAPDPALRESDAAMRTWFGTRYLFDDPDHGGFRGSGVDANPAGSIRTCWIDPANPQRSMLMHDLNSVMWFYVWLFGMFLLFGTCALAYFLPRVWRRPRLGANTVADACASVGDNAGAAAQPADRTRPILYRHKGVSPWGRLARSLIVVVVPFLLFAPFAAHVIDGLGKAEPHGLLLLLVPLFAFAGRSSIKAVGHNLLAVFNPRVQLTIDAQTLRPGGRARLHWNISGSSHRLTRLTLVLRADELATYTERRQNDIDEVTEVHAAHHAVLFDSTDPAAIRQGHCELSLPADAPPTFVAPNNQLRWSVAVHGEIPRWPDIEEPWKLEVQPPAGPIRIASHLPSGNAVAAGDTGLGLRLSPSAGGRVEGHVTWNLPTPPGGMELRLFWYTSGRGSRDLEIVERVVIDATGKQGERPFRMTLQPAPRPYAGNLVTIIWALELVADEGKRVVQLDLPVEPVRTG